MSVARTAPCPVFQTSETKSPVCGEASLTWTHSPLRRFGGLILSGLHSATTLVHNQSSVGALSEGAKGLRPRILPGAPLIQGPAIAAGLFLRRCRKRLAGSKVLSPACLLLTAQGDDRRQIHLLELTPVRSKAVAVAPPRVLRKPTTGIERRVTNFGYESCLKRHATQKEREP